MLNFVNDEAFIRDVAKVKQVRRTHFCSDPNFSKYNIKNVHCFPIIDEHKMILVTLVVHFS